MNKIALEQDFYEIFGAEGEKPRFFFAPGRFNLIGEHTDYNGGHVLPCAVNMGIYAIARKRKDKRIYLYSRQKKGILSFSLNDCKIKGWAQYPMSVIQLLHEQHSFSNGLEIYFHGTLPTDSGLSSSAAIEAASALSIDHLFVMNLSLKDLALICHKAENTIVGVHCGIMDQFAVFLPQKDHGLYLNCRNQEYEHIPINLKDHSFILVHSETYRSLDAGLYNHKRQICEKGLRILAPKLGIRHLCEMSPEDFEKNKHILPENMRSIIRHPVYEEARVKKAVHCLNNNDITGLGEVLYASHRSLKEDFQVTNEALDILFEEARSMPEVLGARMTGAGFGGCTINIVKKDAVKHFQKKMEMNYHKRTGLIPAFYRVNADGGARELI